MSNHVAVRSQMRYKYQINQYHNNYQTPESILPEKESVFTRRKRQFRKNLECEQQEQQTCNLLAVNDKIRENKLKVIGDQITHLVQDPNISGPLQPDNCARIKTILRIYWKLLNLSPLEFYINSKEAIYNQERFNVLDSRLQVLHYIENLDGYCDAINKLRLILKSQTMVSVMTAFHKIICEVEAKKA